MWCSAEEPPTQPSLPILDDEILLWGRSGFAEKRLNVELSAQPFLPREGYLDELMTHVSPWNPFRKKQPARR